jgi:bacteriocin-like protein
MNANTSGISEIRELTDDELDAVNGGKEWGAALVVYGCANGSHFGSQISWSGPDGLSLRKAGE